MLYVNVYRRVWIKKPDWHYQLWLNSFPPSTQQEKPNSSLRQQSQFIFLQNIFLACLKIKQLPAFLAKDITMSYRACIWQELYSYQKSKKRWYGCKKSALVGKIQVLLPICFPCWFPSKCSDPKDWQFLQLHSNIYPHLHTTAECRARIFKFYIPSTALLIQWQQWAISSLCLLISRSLIMIIYCQVLGLLKCFSNSVQLPEKTCQAM